jgi:DNA-binding NarL/FixJ family response regulator
MASNGDGIGASDATAPAGSAISVLVVEDDEALQRDLVEMIDVAPGIALRAAARSLSAARSALTAHGAPDVLLVDLGLPDGDGTELISELAVHSPATSALVITVFGDEAHVVRALEAGARGYLLKDATLDELARAVRLVHEGGSPLSPMIARHLLKRFASLQARSRIRRPAVNGEVATEHLTAREAEILRLIAGGKTVAEAAARLNLSPHTVTTHVKHIYGKLAVNNRVQAVNRARATGQLD